MNDLEKYFKNNTGRMIHKWQHYFEIYDRHFSRFRGTDVHMLEIGVSHGGSLQMWKDYFGPEARIYGVDINPHCKELEDEQATIFIGDQADRGFLRSLGEQVPRIDILLDDGGHTMIQQIHTFEELFHKIEPNGVYLCEDLHTSYWAHRDGGYRKQSSFIEYSKRFIDKIHAWHSRSRRLKVDDFTRSAYSLHYYDSILAIEKRPMSEPYGVESGERTVPTYRAPINPLRRVKRKVGREIEKIKRG